MNDSFSILPLTGLLKIILNQYDNYHSILGIPEDLFFVPDVDDKFRTRRFGSLLETPMGIAAGPHAQLAQNIVAAWLTGARFIELKTIQTLDELEITKPCIDMQDEGYNCEWSQELKIAESFDQYLNAWIIIHILRDKFNWIDTSEPGLVFNMSVGYDYAGIIKDNVQWFFSKMADASEELDAKIESIKSIYPKVVHLDISPRISNNITLSTMHGCPPDEIEKIGAYLIMEKRLHTAIKLNPTLLGKDDILEILRESGFETDVPEIAFDHDLRYDEAVKIIQNLQQKADESRLQFSIKLTNTLQCVNNKQVFGSNEEMMYMSGRALHPISIKLASRLQNEFNGKQDISFSGGVDAFNVAEVISCGLDPVTVCTDLLKPGGYGRLFQYIEKLRSGDFMSHSPEAALSNLRQYSDDICNINDYQKNDIREPSIKTDRPLGYFDCIHAPCVDTCPTNQDIPGYLYYTSQGDNNKALEIIRNTNPFPHTTGMICDHACQTKCTRINYDSPLLIREVKRFVAENEQLEKSDPKAGNNMKGKLVATVIGAGPSGLSCAYFLALAGIQVNIYEIRDKPGGMINNAIPSFRLSNEAIDLDVHAILQLGVHINYNQVVNRLTFKLFREFSDFVYIGVGAQKSTKINIPGSDALGILDPLEFLYEVKKGMPTGIGSQVVIVGGGNTAMDAARTAYRLVGDKGTVTIVYRRTMKQMPADTGEIKAVLEEGINIVELSSPIRINTKDGHAVSLSCIRMRLGDKDESGRASPLEIPGSEFEILMDTVIPAIGQETDLDFLETTALATKSGSYETKMSNVYIGGDAMRGASTAINAIGDGRKAAQEIIEKAGILFNTRQIFSRKEQSLDQHMINRARRILPQHVVETSIQDRKNFNIVSETLLKDEAMQEASRCLQCDEICNICTTVCPNLAFFSYEIDSVDYKLQCLERTGDNMEITEGSLFAVKQKYQILHIADWCNQCGNCDTFCPSAGSPHSDKPHLYLDRKSFEKENDGCFLDTENEVPVLVRHIKDQAYKLSISGNFARFETRHAILMLDSNHMRIVDIEVKDKADFELDLTIAAEMKIILNGAIAFLAVDK